MADIEALRKQMIEASKRKVTLKYEDKDIHIIKSVGILEDIDPIANLLIEQLREWHAVHFPELNDMVKDNDVYVKLVSSIGKRDDFTEKKILEQIEDKPLATQIAEAAKKSIGSGATPADLAEMKSLALNCLNLRQEREYLSKYLEETMKRELPNFTEIAGPVIGAKILAKLGSKKRLAFVPASTIQMIGAEKALFMHFRKGVKGPKYGYLFQHPMVKASPDHQKGKIARSLAATLAIAAKKDYFGNKTSADDLKEKLEERIEALKKSVNAKPGATQEMKPRQERNNFREFRTERPRPEFRPRAEYGAAPRRERSGAREGFAPRPDYGGYRPRTEGGYKPLGEGGFKPRGEGGFKPLGEGEFRPRPEYGAPRRPRRDDGDGFKPRDKFVHSSKTQRPEGKPQFRTPTGEKAGGYGSDRKPFSMDSVGKGGHRQRKGGRKQWGSRSRR